MTVEAVTAAASRASDLLGEFGVKVPDDDFAKMIATEEELH